MYSVLQLLHIVLGMCVCMRTRVCVCQCPFVFSAVMACGKMLFLSLFVLVLMDL